MKKNIFKYLVVKFYPLIITSTVFLFIIFMVLGFIVKSDASNVLFALSFTSLLLYVPSFLLISKLQKQKWFIKFNRCFTLKDAKIKNELILKQKAKELLNELGIKE